MNDEMKAAFFAIIGSWEDQLNEEACHFVASDCLEDMRNFIERFKLEN